MKTNTQFFFENFTPFTLKTSHKLKKKIFLKDTPNKKNKIKTLLKE
jgi:hypothetical protein